MATAVTALNPGLRERLASSRTFAALQTDDPAVVSPWYTRMQPRWEKCRALMLGTEAIRDGMEAFLPRLEGEEDDAYNFRRVLAAVFPGFSRTIFAGVGMILVSEPTFEDMPDEVIELAEDIDARGTHWLVMVAEMILSGMIDGMDGILVDELRLSDITDISKASAAVEDSTKPLSADDAERLNLRPYMRLYKIDDIIKPIYETINGVRTLTLLSLREEVQKRVGKFGFESSFQYRVYQREPNGVITYQRYVEPAGGGARTPLGEPEVLEGWEEIQWAPFIPGLKLSEDEYLPTLTYLADLNIMHHQVQTNILNLETLGCVPTPVRIGAERDPRTQEYPVITTGPRSVIEAPWREGMPPMPFYWTSPDVAVLQPSQQTLDKIEGAMSKEGGAFLAPDPSGVESEGAKIIKGLAQRASLSMVAQGAEDTMERAFGWMARMLGVEGGSINFNREFEKPMLDSATMLAYITAVVDAGLPMRILLEAWQKGGRIDEDEDLDALEATMMANVLAAKKEKAEAAAKQAELMAKGGGQPPKPGDPAPPKPPVPVAE